MIDKVRFFLTEGGGWYGYDVEAPEEYDIAHSSVKCNTQRPSQKRLIGIV